VLPFETPLPTVVALSTAAAFLEGDVGSRRGDNGDEGDVGDAGASAGGRKVNCTAPLPLPLLSSPVEASLAAAMEASRIVFTVSRNVTFSGSKTPYKRN
jgi:hypothetical protein